MINHDEYTARQTGHAVACDCETCCAVRTEAHWADKLVPVQFQGGTRTEPAGEPIPAPDRGVRLTAVADRCSVCRLPAHLTDVPNTHEPHPVLGVACYACRDTHDTGAKILEQLSRAPSVQLNQTTMARKLGRKPSTLNRVLAVLVRQRLIDRAYKNNNLEKPSATTYKLTDAGSRAHFANTETKEQNNV